MISEWLTTCAALGHLGTPMYYLRLKKQYNDPTRHYHTWNHIEYCFKALKKYFPKERGLADVKMALFFHDVVYDAMANDNEERSAEQFEQYARARGIDGFVANTISQMILATKTHEVHKSLAPRNEYIMLDIDMSIFVADQYDYLKYAKNVWKEYRAYGLDAYVQGRLAFLKKLDPQGIFYTPELKLLSGRIATNIQNEVDNLENRSQEFLV